MFKLKTNRHKTAVEAGTETADAEAADAETADAETADANVEETGHDFRADRHNKIELPQELWLCIRNGTYIICTKRDGKQLFGYLTNYMPDKNLIKMRTGYRKTPGGFVTAKLDEIITIQAEADAITMFLISKINAIVNVLSSK